MSLSSAVPWWGAILIALLTGILAVGATLAGNWQRDRHRRAENRRASYLRLLAASEVVVFRSTVARTQRSIRSALSKTIPDVQKAVVVMALAAMAERSTRWRSDRLRMIADSLPMATAPSDAQSPAALFDAFEELLHARVEVHLCGSQAAIDAADDLLEASERYVEILESQNWSWSGLPSQDILAKQREAMLTEHRRFLEIVRAES